jgi:hypothetical protein
MTLLVFTSLQRGIMTAMNRVVLKKKPPLDNKVAAREKVLTESNIALTQGAPRIKWPELSYQAVGKSSA